MSLSPLKKVGWITAGLTGGFLLLLGALWITLPLLLSTWHPLGISWQLQGRLGWSQQRLTVPALQLIHQGMPLLSMSAATLHYGANDSTPPHWQFTIQQLKLNTPVWQTVIASAASRPRAQPVWLSQLPPWQLTIQQLILDPALDAPLSVTLSQQAGGLQLEGQHPSGQLQATLDPQRRLRLSAQLAAPGDQIPMTLQGELQLGKSLRQWPSSGQLQLQLPKTALPEAAQITLQWQGHQGQIRMITPQSAQPLLELPWQWQSQCLQFQPGRWAWPYAAQPLQGALQLQLSDWQRPLGRYGRLQSRWQLSNAPWGPVTLRLNGIMTAPSVDQATLQWEYQAQGILSAQQTPWQSEGRGTWQLSQQQLTIQQLSATLAKWTPGPCQGEQLRLTLKAPLQYSFLSRAATHSFSTAWRLMAERLWLPHRRCLRQPRLDLQLQGRSLQQLTWQGVLRSGQIAPITGKGHWNGQVLQGDLHWREPSFQRLQPLLPPQQPWSLKQGVLHHTAKFTASADHGLAVVGLLELKNAAIGLKEGAINGINLHLPYRWQRQWQVGKPDQLATLQIEELRQILTLRHIVLKVQGRLPYSQRDPLQLSGQIGEILGGSLILPALWLPQQAQPGLLTLTHIDLAQLSALLGHRGIQLTGQISGRLPLYTGDSHWLINRGYLWNTTPLTSTLDKATADRLRQPGMTERVMDWMTQLQIQQARAQVQLDTLGVLTLQAHLKGNTPQQPQQPVQLQYQHQENLLTLWRSLRASGLLQQQIEQQAPALRRLHP
ncbi:intermembrane phospholipid transport protein YdbH family protein [unidentified bacterial endosymbiont]|uniref:intermembrane phospholipid transport protein YdbH family protein n=1 Tax=unidentified bacterial endosymbiont TaxID=2355 RepID=UPI0020A1DF02|nr:YdbH domain-containing protein [unidentified bacterial endosymbiont]